MLWVLFLLVVFFIIVAAKYKKTQVGLVPVKEPPYPVV